MRVLVACEFSGIVRDAFRARGHDAWSCDLLETERPGPHIQGDVLEVLGDDWDLVIAHPPCTHLCSMGIWWNHKRPERWPSTHAAAQFVARIDACKAPRLSIENPVGWLNTHWRRPSQTIYPWQFGHEANKPTCCGSGGCRPSCPRRSSARASSTPRPTASGPRNGPTARAGPARPSAPASPAARSPASLPRWPPSGDNHSMPTVRRNSKKRTGWDRKWGKYADVLGDATPAVTPDTPSSYRDCLEPGMTAAEAIRAFSAHAAANGDLAAIWQCLVDDARSGNKAARDLFLQYAMPKPKAGDEGAADTRHRPDLTKEEIDEIERVIGACYPEGDIVSQIQRPSAPTETPDAD